MKLTNKLKTGALTGLMGLTGACSTMGAYETRDVCNSLFVFTPGFLEPGACKDARAEVSARHAEDRYMQREKRSGVTVTTPEGYMVNLRPTEKVFYKNEEYYIYNISNLNVELAPKGKYSYDTNNTIWVPIKELDMFKK